MEMFPYILIEIEAANDMETLSLFLRDLFLTIPVYFCVDQQQKALFISFHILWGK